MTDILFQSTPPIRVATNTTGATIRRTRFQSTPPIRVATAMLRKGMRKAMISIHATHTGGDGKSTESPFCGQDFNPRHPYGWRQMETKKAIEIMLFQSTPPIRVATAAVELMDDDLRISIHATHTGGDSKAGQKRHRRLKFQSTPPIRVATANFKT